MQVQPTSRRTVMVPTELGEIAATLTIPDDPVGRCLFVPPYGATVADHSEMIDRLAAAGVEVASFDPRNHVGASTGSIDNFTLSSYATDCLHTISSFSPDCVFAIGLGARAAMRALRFASSVPAAVYLNPVGDVERFMNSQRFASGRSPLRAVRRDARRHDFLTIASTTADLVAYPGPIGLLIAPDSTMSISRWQATAARFANRDRIFIQPVPQSTAFAPDMFVIKQVYIATEGLTWVSWCPRSLPSRTPRTA